MIDIDVDVPEKIPSLLREAAQAFYESTSELQAAWGDPRAGKVWEKMGAILERAADSCEKAITRWV